MQTILGIGQILEIFSKELKVKFRHTQETTQNRFPGIFLGAIAILAFAIYGCSAQVHKEFLGFWEVDLISMGLDPSQSPEKNLGLDIKAPSGLSTFWDVPLPELNFSSDEVVFKTSIQLTFLELSGYGSKSGEGTLFMAKRSGNSLIIKHSKGGRDLVLTRREGR